MTVSSTKGESFCILQFRFLPLYFFTTHRGLCNMCWVEIPPIILQAGTSMSTIVTLLEFSFVFIPCRLFSIYLVLVMCSRFFSLVPLYFFCSYFSLPYSFLQLRSLPMKMNLQLCFNTLMFSSQLNNAATVVFFISVECIHFTLLFTFSTSSEKVSTVGVVSASSSPSPWSTVLSFVSIHTFFNFCWCNFLYLFVISVS